MKNFWSVSIVHLLLLYLDSSSATYKRWLRNTNFDNPDNWNIKRVPCGNDVVVIPEDSPVVYVQLSTTVKELILPKNGELMLGQNMRLGFTADEAPTGCSAAGGDLEFAAVHPEPWLNPDNWCSAQTERGACDVSNFTLDLEKVPCTYDDVIFPRDNSYFVDISENTPPLSAKTLKISGSPFTSVTFTNFLNSTDGRRMFRSLDPGPAGNRLNITRRGCDVLSGCACGNDRPEISKAICSHAEKRCGRARCSKTIQPVGACCKLCGAVFNITRGQGFDFKSFTSSLRTQFLTGGTQNGVNMTTSLTSDGWVQVVLVDVTGEQSAILARKMMEDFNNDLASGGHKYAISNVQFSLDTDSSTSSHSAQSGDSMTGGSIAGIVFGILVVIVIIIVVVIVVVFRRTGRQIPTIHLPTMPNFGGFPRRAPGASARVLPGVFLQPHTASHVDPGFANPLYDSSPFDDGNVMREMELISASVENQPTFDVSEGGFHNPLFGSAEVSMFRDPVSVPEPGGTKLPSGKTSTGSSRPVSATLTIDNPTSTNGDSTI